MDKQTLTGLINQSVKHIQKVTWRVTIIAGAIFLTGLVVAFIDGFWGCFMMFLSLPFVVLGIRALIVGNPRAKDAMYFKKLIQKHPEELVRAYVKVTYSGKAPMVVLQKDLVLEAKFGQLMEIAGRILNNDFKAAIELLLQINPAIKLGYTENAFEKNVYA